LPEVYRRVKHFKGEPYDVEIANPAYPAELRERCVRLFRENRVNYFSDSAAYKAIAPKLGFVAQISIIWDSRHESSVIAGVYGQLDTYDVQDPELGRV
jgi:hypothetical protein